MILMRDVFESVGDHTVSLTFQCAPGIRAQLTALTAHRALARRCGICRVETSGTTRGGEFAIEEAWVSTVYGARERAQRCRFVARVGPGTTVLTSVLRMAPDMRADVCGGEASALTETR